jgi:hypothetical protein
MRLAEKLDWKGLKVRVKFALEHAMKAQRGRRDIYLITYLLTPWSRVLLEQLIGSQLVKKVLSFYGTRRFITALTRARHLSLWWGFIIEIIYYVKFGIQDSFTM